MTEKISNTQQKVTDKYRNNPIWEPIDPYILCKDRGHEHHKSLKFCPKCYANATICEHCHQIHTDSKGCPHGCNTKSEESHSTKSEELTYIVVDGFDETGAFFSGGVEVAEPPHGFTDINARLAMDYVEMKRCDERGWASDCKEAANTITILREENKQLRESK